MEEKLKRMKIRQTLAGESEAVRGKIEQVEEKIIELFETLEKKKIVIPSRKDRKITQIEEKIYSNEIMHYSITLHHKEKILKILQKLLKTPVVVLIVQGIKNIAHSWKTATVCFFAAIGKSFVNAFHFVGGVFVSIGNAIARPFRRIKQFYRAQQGKAHQKRIARKIAKEEEAQKKKDAEIAKQMLEQQTILEAQTSAMQTVVQPTAQEETQLATYPEQEEVPSPTPLSSSPEPSSPPVITQPAYTTMEPQSQQAPHKEKRRHIPLIVAIGILLLLFIGTILYIFISHSPSWRESPAIKPDDSATNTLASCLNSTESIGSDVGKTIHTINQRLNEASYCCFENCATTIDKNSFEIWKARHLVFIQCVVHNLPKNHVLAVIGHANRTGFEEDTQFLNGPLPADKVVTGNFSYSFNRAKAILKEIEGSINRESVVFYGVGSSQPAESPGVLPEGDMNRRITFKLVEKEESTKQKATWDEKLKIVKKL